MNTFLPDPGVFEAIVAMRAWFLTKPEITRVHFYGSRLVGGFTQKSDLDVAIELNFSDEPAGRFFWQTNLDEWNKEIDAASHYDVHLEYLHPATSQNVAKYLTDGSMVIYSSDPGNA